MTSDGSVTHWIAQLQAGDQAALEGLWHRYFARLAGLARQKLRGTPRRIADEEDVVLSAFDTFCRNVTDGRYPRLADRDDLWRLLVAITTQKAANLARYEGRQKRSAPNPEQLADLDQILAGEPTPEFAAQVAEECQHLLGRLASDELRQVALLKMEGYTNEEIAGRLGCVLRTVERKLHVIRKRWEENAA